MPPHFRIISICAIPLLLILGCAPRTAQGLRENNAGVYSFEVEKNYQPVYRTILEQSRECFQGPSTVQGDLYTDVRHGNISVFFRDIFFGIHTFAVIDLSAVSDNVTKVETYYYVDSWSPIAAAVEQWVKSDFKGCRFQE